MDRGTAISVALIGAVASIAAAYVGRQHVGNADPTLGAPTATPEPVPTNAPPSEPKPEPKSDTPAQLDDVSPAQLDQNSLQKAEQTRQAQLDEVAPTRCEGGYWVQTVSGWKRDGYDFPATQKAIARPEFAGVCFIEIGGSNSRALVAVLPDPELWRDLRDALVDGKASSGVVAAPCKPISRRHFCVTADGSLTFP